MRIAIFRSCLSSNILERKINIVKDIWFSFINISNCKNYSKAADVMKVLNVAEKNDAAKNIAGYISHGNYRKREGLSVYNKIYEFTATVLNQNCQMIMTSVSGHLLNHDFIGNYRRWTSCHPLTLFDVPVSKECIEESSQKIKSTLEREIKKCSVLIIWTDCDREGENIGYEIINVCQAVKPNIRIYRAKFSEITQASINRAIQTLSEPDKAVSDAVDVRSELDLRIGAAFTRFQTLYLQKKFPRSLADMLISYGSCQFPTLGFVVERFLAIEAFQSEPYWKLKVTDLRDNLTVDFSWGRGRLFEKPPCQALLDECLDDPNATVKKVISKPKSKWRPLPLDTIELEKQGSRKLRLSAKETMRIAEKLYTQGFISYPRTETNIFPKELNLLPLVKQQENNPQWGNFAQRLVQEGITPRQGKKSDQAHPPIHPTKSASNLQGNEAKVYEFVVRHFLACLAKNAVGQETIVEIEIAGEDFTATGLQVLERNYLDVYIYERWSDKEIPVYRQGQIFQPTSIEMLEEKTSAPKLLTEADLITLMDKHGIGTDATHAEHIDTIKSRQYIGLVDDKHLMPGKLGIGLVMGYDNMGFQMSKPNLRAELENDLKLICERRKNPQEVLQEQVNKYREVFKKALEKANMIDTALAQYLGEQPTETQEQLHLQPQETTVFKCPKCDCDMVLKTSKDGTKKYIGCMGFPTCRNAVWFPQTVENVEVLNEFCSDCTEQRHKLKFKINRNALPLYGGEYVTCIGGCDSSFNEALSISRERVKKVEQNNTGGSSTFSNFAIPSSTSQPRQNMSQRPAETRRNPSNNNTSVAPATKYRRTNTSDRVSEDLQSNNSSSWEIARTPSITNTAEVSRTWGHIDQDAVVMCNCHERAIQLTVRKDGPNHGRQFFKCPKPSGTNCNFFLWATDAPAQSNTSTNSNQSTAGNSRSYDSGLGSSFVNWGANNKASTSGTPQCNCNQQAVRRTVQKEGPNKGREFYACTNMSNSCKFFQWADEDSTPRQQYGRDNRNYGSTNNKNTGKQRATGGKRKCGICGVEGHTRKTCPQNVMD